MHIIHLKSNITAMQITDLNLPMFFEWQLYIRILALLVGAWILIFGGRVQVDDNFGTVGFEKH